MTTAAGAGNLGFGDGGPATAAALDAPVAARLDLTGNLFIADTLNDRIRRVDVSGNITTVAGSGEEGYFGDGGPATAAALAFPSGVAMDSAGNLFVADNENHSVRRVEAASGNITTVAGTGEAGFSGDGGPATAATLAFPFGVALDAADNLLIADTVNNRIRLVDASSGLIATVAGSGQVGSSGDGGPAQAAALAGPSSVTVGPSGNLFIVDRCNSRIRVVLAPIQ